MCVLLLQTEREDVPVLLVGGGSILVDCQIPLRGASKVILPSDHWVRDTTQQQLSKNLTFCG